MPSGGGTQQTNVCRLENTTGHGRFEAECPAGPTLVTSGAPDKQTDFIKVREHFEFHVVQAGLGPSSGGSWIPDRSRPRDAWQVLARTRAVAGQSRPLGRSKAGGDPVALRAGPLAIRARAVHRLGSSVTICDRRRHADPGGNMDNSIRFNYGLQESVHPSPYRLAGPIF